MGVPCTWRDIHKNVFLSLSMSQIYHSLICRPHELITSNHIMPFMSIYHFLTITAHCHVLGWRTNIIVINECILIYYWAPLVLKLTVFSSLESGYVGFFVAISMVPNTPVFFDCSCDTFL